MANDERLAALFEQNRPRLQAVAYRMLSSRSEAEDAVQEAWLRVSRAETSEVENPSGWLTTVVARICLDALRARKARREEPEPEPALEPSAATLVETSPEQQTLLGDSVGLALLVVLDTLSPPERLAFVLHDLFDLPFEEIAPIVGVSAVAARQLASRARRRVQGAPADSSEQADLERKRSVVEAFLLASRGGDLGALLAVLDPEVVLRPDSVAIAASVANRARGAPELSPEVRGPAAVAKVFTGGAQAAQLAIIDGVPGAVWAPNGVPRAVFRLTFVEDKIVAIDLIVDPKSVRNFEVELVG
ncbi:MAG TPA: sigma-70 family RNA polymerase sigma factor [Polyangiaceae bacterium]|nr:sigma-70 family RNA polymerase sigma factor [Polyangiaceae bacterium]